MLACVITPSNPSPELTNNSMRNMGVLIHSASGSGSVFMEVMKTDKTWQRCSNLVWSTDDLEPYGAYYDEVGLPGGRVFRFTVDGATSVSIDVDANS